MFSGEENRGLFVEIFYKAPCYNQLMIGYLRGNVIETNEKSIILDVRGVGYLVYMSPTDLPLLGDEIGIHINTVVKEDAIELFGFRDKKTKDFFVMLISISGIGPRGALGILALAPVDSLMGAISKGDASFLTKVSGIGKKTAEKIVLELKDKVGDISGHYGANISGDIFDALTALGYSAIDIREAISSLPEDIDMMDTQLIIRSVLRIVRKQ
jgi:Holliday junction DNA helicase RuvA